MHPIMDLQGSRLGFKTDMDSKGGYKLHVVRDAVVEACMHGLMPVGNHFNIIASNMYVTKEGLTYLLAKMAGLSRLKIKIKVGEITEKITKAKTKEGKTYDRVDRDADVQAVISCVYLEEKIEETLDLVIRVNAMMGHDAIIGKAERKAKAWLHNYLTGSGLGEGDADDAAPVAEMRDVTPARDDSSAAPRAAAMRAARARGGLRGAAPVQPVAPTPAPAPSLKSESVDTPAPVPAAAPSVGAPALNLDSAQDDISVTSDMQMLVKELEFAKKMGNSKATPYNVCNWMKKYLNMPDLDMPVRGMLWQPAINLTIANHAKEFDTVFGTTLSKAGGAA